MDNSKARTALAVPVCAVGESARPCAPDATALHLLGVVAAGRGDLKTAAALLVGAIEQAGPRTEYCLALGRVLHAQGKLAEAATVYRRALSDAPGNAALQFELARTLLATGDSTTAIRALATYLGQNPADATAWHMLGNTFVELGDDAAAAEGFRQAAWRQPQWAEAHYDLAIVLARLGRNDEAEAAYRRAISLAQTFPEAHNNLANLLRRGGRAGEAVQELSIALAERPTYLEARYNLGLALADLDRLEEAAECYRAVVKARPDFAAAHNNLGTTLEALGRRREALAHYSAAVRHEPSNDAFRVNRGMLRLLEGDYARGWRDYDHRPTPAAGAPLWQGTAAPEEVLLVSTEQGFGDSLQFIRFARPAARRGTTVVVECQPALARLLATAEGVARVIPAGSTRPAYHSHAPLLSLPRILGITRTTIPSETPYLACDPELAHEWRTRLGASTRLKVGLAWAGSREHPKDRRRSLPPEELRALTLLDATFVSLQPEYPAGRTESGLDFTPLDRAFTDFADSAALVAGLDLVITVDTAAAHLAGALARPVWTLLAAAPDWRWSAEGERTPWYPTMRLFRQRRRGDWGEVMARVRNELEQLIARRRTGENEPLPRDA